MAQKSQQFLKKCIILSQDHLSQTVPWLQVATSAGNGAVVAGVSLRPPVNRSSDVVMHCGCAELISECQLHNGMDIFCLFRERI